MSSMMNNVRAELLQEAIASPNLLADIANLERYVAESYSGRSFIELLQNADDAIATRFYVFLLDGWIVCANDGNPFTEKDFRALCRSASSGKRRGETIGYRGIGFKSVVGIASEVHLFSEGLEATFSKQLTQKALNSTAATPLVRVPHELSLKNADVLCKVRALQTDGFRTIFVLGGVERSQAAEELAKFESEYLLFLRKIERVVLRNEVDLIFECTRHLGTDHSKVILTSAQQNTSWRIYSSSGCDVAVACNGNTPTALRSDAALVHAFLPTLESTGLGVRINADFSTDPSRTRIVLDEDSNNCLDSAVACISQLYLAALENADSDMLACLAPTFDLSTIALQRKIFRTELIGRLRVPLMKISEKTALIPTWLDAEDAKKVVAASSKPVLAPHGPTANQQISLLRYAGVKTLAVPDLLTAAVEADLSEGGYAKLVANILLDPLQTIPSKKLAQARVWFGNNGRTALTDIPENGKLSASFNSELKAAGIRPADFVRLVHSADAAQSLLPEDTNQITIKPFVDPAEAQQDFYSFLAGGSGHSERINVVGRSVPAWRNAETYVATLLNSNGFLVEDTSRQNLGYDLVATKNSEKAFIEVKLVDWLGAPFTLTSNEHAVARQNRNNYFIVLVMRSRDDVRLEFIRDPTNVLQFERQCKQWVWECSDYKLYNQHIIEI